jgi:hypothetical protein
VVSSYPARVETLDGYARRRGISRLDFGRHVLAVDIECDWSLARAEHD